jgi:hypothetical protein
VKNLQAYAAEGMVYVEYQIGAGAYEGPDGETIDTTQAFDILRETLARKDVRDLGVTARFQLAILRFLPNAEDQLRRAFMKIPTCSSVSTWWAARTTTRATRPASCRHCVSCGSSTAACDFRSTPVRWMSQTSTCATPCCSAPIASATAST